MTIHHIVHVEGLNALTDLVQMIYEELNIINTRATCPVEVKDEQPAKETKPRKRYKGTYTDEQSISKLVGRKVTREEVKDAANKLHVSSLQDETNHHVYILNTNLDLVVRYLKRKK
jgi:hypothetical protein